MAFFFPIGESKQVVGGGGGGAWAQSLLFLPHEIRLEVERREPTQLLSIFLSFFLFSPEIPLLEDGRHETS
jgi:hypothetical protein